VVHDVSPQLQDGSGESWANEQDLQYIGPHECHAMQKHVINNGKCSGIFNSSERKKKGKCACSSLWIGKPSELRSITCHMGSHSVTCHATQVNVPHLNPSHAGRYSTYLPRGMEGWVDLGVGYIPRWLTCPQTVTHPGTNHLIVTRQGVEPTTSQSRMSNILTITLPSHL